MMIRGWKRRYLEILKEFKYDGRRDEESAIALNLILRKTDAGKKIAELVKGRTVFVIGSGPSLSSAIIKLKDYKNIVKIAADSSVKPLVENGIMPDIVVTDLDGDRETLEKIGRTKSVLVVHAHGDNLERLEMSRKFKNCIGTAQSSPIGKVQNFGGFTDGDRSVFLADHFEAKKIILFGMDFGTRVGRFSNTDRQDRKLKLMKLKKAESLLGWLSTFAKAELFTTSRPIEGFRKVSYKELDIIIT